MNVSSESFVHHQPIPEEFAFARIDPRTHATLSANRNPQLSWSDLPADCKSLALIVVDPDAPTVADDVNKEGREVSADLPRAGFHHWVMVDIAPTCPGIAAGECSDGVTPHGKQDPPSPTGATDARQGVNDYTSWFTGDPDMGGRYFGYDGPGPPWNDQRMHRYHFNLYALDIERCAVEGAFTAADVKQAIEGHVLAEAVHTGTYTLNPTLRG